MVPVKTLGLVIASLFILVMGLLTRVSAQEATPAAPSEVECQVEPRSAESVLELWLDVGGSETIDQPTRDPGATPVVFGSPTAFSEPADAETVSGVTATVYEAFACFNAGELARTLALLTDDAVRNLKPGAVDPFGVQPSPLSPGIEFGATPEATPTGEREQLLALFATPAPVPVGERKDVVEVHTVRILDTEPQRVGAVVVTRSAPGAEEETFFIAFEKVGDRWLIDQILSDEEVVGTPTP